MQSINQSIHHASQLANLIHLLACMLKLARVHAKDYRHGCGCDREKGDRGYVCSFAAAYRTMVVQNTWGLRDWIWISRWPYLIKSDN
jgi:hypothetical protein